jgi:hypothetical protein
VAARPKLQHAELRRHMEGGLQRRVPRQRVPGFPVLVTLVFVLVLKPDGAVLKR